MHILLLETWEDTKSPNKSFGQVFSIMPLASMQAFPKIIWEIMSQNSKTSGRSRQNNYYFYPCFVDEKILAGIFKNLFPNHMEN